MNTQIECRDCLTGKDCEPCTKGEVCGDCN